MKIALKMESSWIFLMFVNIFFLLSPLGPAAGFCPRGCECEELRLKVSCSNSTLDVLPIALNTRIEHIRMNFNKIRIVDASFQVGEVAVTWPLPYCIGYNIYLLPVLRAPNHDRPIIKHHWRHRGQKFCCPKIFDQIESRQQQIIWSFNEGR